MKYRKKLFLITLAGGLLTLGCFFVSLTDREPLQYLTRPQSGDGDDKAGLLVELNGEKYPFELTLKEVPCEKEALDHMLKEALDGMGTLFLHGNRDFEHITEPVFMPSVYPDTRISIRWYLDSWDYMAPDGTVRNEILKEPEPVNVQAVLSMGEESLIWEQKILICPPEDPDDGQLLRLLEYELQESQELPSGQLALPDTVLGEPVIWYPKADDRWKWMLALTVLTLAAVAAGQKKEEDTVRRIRERGMQLDYPDIVSRLSLYMGAGISTRKAWERIVSDYEEREAPDRERHAAYEEMRTALREMQSGVAESAAYERFGSRCRMPAYLKLGALLSQNLRKGTRNLAELLKAESREAFEERKALAKRLGEECESRLLLPMIMMLLTILIIILYPAAAGLS